MKKGILFRVVGGLGKNLTATRIARAIKKANPDLPLHVVASYPDAWAGLDFVDAFFPPAPLPYFYESHRDFEIVEAEPYTDLAYRQGETHIVEAWARRVGIADPKERAGVIRLTAKERAAADLIVGQLRQQAAGRPLVGLQVSGGVSSYSPQDALNPNRFGHVRELPPARAQELANELAEAGFFTVQVLLPTETRLQNAAHLIDSQGNAFPSRVVFAVLDRLDGLVAIDSFAAHAWAALGKSGAVVLWGATRPTNLGYENQINRTPPANCCPTPGCNRPESHVGDWSGTGAPWACPHDGACMASHVPKEIVLALKNSLNKKTEKQEAAA